MTTTTGLHRARLVVLRGCCRCVCCVKMYGLSAEGVAAEQLKGQAGGKCNIFTTDTPTHPHSSLARPPINALCTLNQTSAGLFLLLAAGISGGLHRGLCLQA